MHGVPVFRGTRVPVQTLFDYLERLRLLFSGHDCQTARFANLAGLKNGQLLEAAEAAGFDILITVDQNIPDQRIACAIWSCWCPPRFSRYVPSGAAM